MRGQYAGKYLHVKCRYSPACKCSFRQFRKDRGYSPANFIKRVRLNRAKEMLERANGTIITEIAFKCGFPNAGHFARDFRLAFGVLPSDTLRRRNGRRT
jgi:transcriptional regulator GlxA family with amidase domain